MHDKRLDAFGVPDAARAAIQRWLELLREWNARMDLTAARSDDELFDLMLADASALSPHIPERARVVDIGSGAGAPGLPLAIFRPDLSVTLIEPLAKRVSFLRTVLGSIARADIALVREKGEQTAARAPGAWDVAISRATLAPATWVPLGLRLAPSAWALLARDEAPEIGGARREEERAYAWPLTRAERRAARYVRAE